LDSLVPNHSFLPGRWALKEARSVWRFQRPLTLISPDGGEADSAPRAMLTFSPDGAEEAAQRWQFLLELAVTFRQHFGELLAGP